jgi:hypothetical protein
MGLGQRLVRRAGGLTQSQSLSENRHWNRPQA